MGGVVPKVLPANDVVESLYMLPTISMASMGSHSRIYSHGSASSPSLTGFKLRGFFLLSKSKCY